MMVPMPTPFHSLWRPRNEAELEAALNDGTFAESHYLDAKEKAKKPRAYAADMASFAIDGGLLVIGVRENKDTGEFFLAPFGYEDQGCEGVERVALTLCDPPLPVTVEWMPSDLEPGKGYLLVEVPRSSLAPHQVDGVYYGRGDKTKKRLSDSEVERLLLARDASLSRVREMLADLVEHEPKPLQVAGGLDNPGCGVLHVVALPVVRRHRMFVEWTHGSEWEGRLRGLLNTPVEPVKGLAGWGLTHLGYLFRTAGGAGMASQPGAVRNGYETVRLAVLEGGGVWFQDLRATAVEERSVVYSGGGREKYLRLMYDEKAVKYLWDVLQVVCGLARKSGYRGSWDVGVAVTELGGCVAQSVLPYPLHGDDLFLLSRYDRHSYEAVTRASLAELEKSPQLVMDQLVGPLLRSLGSSSEVTRFVELPAEGV